LIRVIACINHVTKKNLLWQVGKSIGVF
jgi:hypothetical protein